MDVKTVIEILKKRAPMIIGAMTLVIVACIYLVKNKEGLGINLNILTQKKNQKVSFKNPVEEEVEGLEYFKNSPIHSPMNNNESAHDDIYETRGILIDSLFTWQ